MKKFLAIASSVLFLAACSKDKGAAVCAPNVTGEMEVTAKSELDTIRSTGDLLYVKTPAESRLNASFTGDNGYTHYVNETFPVSSDEAPIILDIANMVLIDDLQSFKMEEAYTGSRNTREFRVIDLSSLQSEMSKSLSEGLGSDSKLCSTQVHNLTFTYNEPEQNVVMSTEMTAKIQVAVRAQDDEEDYVVGEGY